jgi:hypothetical protein
VCGSGDCGIPFLGTPGEIVTVSLSNGRTGETIGSPTGINDKGAFNEHFIERSKLSEHYDLSVIGKLGLSAQVGGYFGVELRGRHDLPWQTRVVVTKTCASEFTHSCPN